MIVGSTQPQDQDLLIKYKPTANITNPFLLQIEYYITMSVPNVLILSIVNPDVTWWVGGWVGKTAPVLPISFEFGTNRYQIHEYHLHYSLLSHENYFHWLIQLAMSTKSSTTFLMANGYGAHLLTSCAARDH